MNFKQIMWKLKHVSILRILAYALLIILVVSLINITSFFWKCSLLPIAKVILKPLIIPNVSSSGIEPKTIFEATLNGANFAIVYISILLAFTALIVTFASIWWGHKINLIRKCHRDYLIFKKNAPLEARLTTAKIFVIDRRFAEAWEEIKDLPDDFNYEIPLFKAKILFGQEHEGSSFGPIMKLLHKARSFPELAEETKSVIDCEISRTYFKEKKDYKKALEYAEKSIEEDYTYCTAYHAKALSLRHLGDLDEAIKTLEDIIIWDRSYDIAYYNLACYYAQKSRTEDNSAQKIILKNKATSYFRKAMDLQPKVKDLVTFSATDPDLDPIRTEINNLPTS